jgi:hypothetical protein
LNPMKLIAQRAWTDELAIDLTGMQHVCCLHVTSKLLCLFLEVPLAESPARLHRFVAPILRADFAPPRH